MTVIGLIGGEPFDSYFDYFRKTNKESVLAYLYAFVNHHYQGNIEDLVIVTDNHGAHRSYEVQQFVTRTGFRMLLLPSMSCTLNPIEHVWSIVKTMWGKQMSKLKTDYNQESLLNDVNLIVSLC